MNDIVALQALNAPDALTTLVVVGAVLLIGRFLLNLAIKIVIIVALVAGVLWVFGATSLVPLLAPMGLLG